MLTSEVSWFAVSGDGTRLVVGDEHKVRVVPSDRKVDNGSSDDAVTVDLSRARFSADPAALWAHAYEEFGRLLRRDFWTPTMSDVDWDGVLDDYRFLLDRIRSSAEFGDLLWEVAAELGTSHAYVMPSSTFTARSTLRGAPAALLGADVARVGRRPLAGRAGAARRVVRPARPLAVRRPRGGGARGRRDPRGRRPPGRPGLRPVAGPGRHPRQAGRADHPPRRPVPGPRAPGRRGRRRRNRRSRRRGCHRAADAATPEKPASAATDAATTDLPHPRACQS